MVCDFTKFILLDEKTAPGSGFKKHKPKKPEEVKVVRAPSPEVIPIPDDDSSADESDSVMNDLMDLTDLTCVTCRNMDTSANNQLFECIECNLLHHQLCHVPKISNETDLTTWICSTCKSKKEKEEGSSKSAKSYESSSSSSSHSNKKPTLNIVSSSEKKKVEVVKKKGKESSSSSSSSRSRSSRK